MKKVSDNIIKKIKTTQFIFNNFFFLNRAVYAIMWKSILGPDRPRMIIWRTCIACWTPKTTNTKHSAYVHVILIAVEPQHVSHERGPVVRIRTFPVLFTHTNIILQNIREFPNVGLTNFLHETITFLRTTFVQLLGNSRPLWKQMVRYHLHVSPEGFSIRKKVPAVHILTLYFHKGHLIINISSNVGLS